MLPRFIYEVLPYLYLSIGLTTGLIFHSSVIFIAASLLIATGISILYMRFSYRRKLQQVSTTTNSLSARRHHYVSRCSADRRRNQLLSFPLIDCYGYLVTYDRRRGERRTSGSPVS